MQPSFPPLLLQFALSAMVMVAAATDIRSRRIPNWLTLSGVLAGLLLNTLLAADGNNWRTSLAGMGLAFLVYFPLYLLRGMGAGDVKLMAAVGALMGPVNWFWIFVISNILGGVAAIVLLLMKGGLWRTLSNLLYMLKELMLLRPPYLRREELDLASARSVKMPHGVAIAMGSLIFLAAVWIWARP